MKILLCTSGWSVNDIIKQEIELSDYFDEAEMEGKSAEELLAKLNDGIYKSQQMTEEFLYQAIEQHSFEWWLEAGL